MTLAEALPTLVTVAILHWVALVVPGPNVLVISNLAAADARRSALFAALGVTCVAAIWATLAVLGVGAVFSAHPFLRIAVQVAGGMYLVYLGVRLWRAGNVAGHGDSSRLTPLAAFRLGFATNITNPKSALFFGSVFATSLPPAPSTSLLVAMVAVAVFNALCWHVFLAIAFSHPRVQAVYARRRSVLSRIAGVLIGAFGARLVALAASEARASSAL